MKKNKANQMDLLACDRPSNLKLDSDRWFFSPCDLEIWWKTSKNNRALLQSINQNVYFSQGTWQIHNTTYITWHNMCPEMRKPEKLGLSCWFLLYFVKLCASCQIHQWIQTVVAVRKRSIRVEIDILSRMTLKLDGWPWKTKGHLFYTTSSFVHHFKAMASYSPEMLNSGQNRQFFVPCDLEIWQMTLKINRAPPLCCFKPCASFHSHW